MFSPAYLRFGFGFAFLFAAAAGCDQLLTEAPDPGEVFDAPFEGLPDELNRMFARGDENFEKVFTVAGGLGPIFNQPGCESCHPADGRGTPALTLVRFSLGDDPAPHLGGPQLQDKATPGVKPETLPPGVDRSVRMPLPSSVWGSSRRSPRRPSSRWPIASMRTPTASRAV